MLETYEEVLRRTDAIPTQRLTLRRFKQEDYLDVYEYGKDELTVKYLIWGPFRTVEDAKENISGYYLSKPGIYAIELTESRKCIGCISFEVAPQHERASVGYVLNRAYWNHGYMSEALNAVIDFCFDCLELNRVEAAHYVGNGASGKVMEKCGMLKEGTHRQEVKIKGDFHDVVHYAILRNQRR